MWLQNLGVDFFSFQKSELKIDKEKKVNFKRFFARNSLKIAMNLQSRPTFHIISVGVFFSTQIWNNLKRFLINKNLIIVFLYNANAYKWCNLYRKRLCFPNDRALLPNLSGSQILFTNRVPYLSLIHVVKQKIIHTWVLIFFLFQSTHERIS